MKMLTPVYDKRIVILQVVVVLFFAVALYFFLYSQQEEKRLIRELATVAEQRGQLEEIQKSVEQFSTVLKKNSELENLTGKPTWEAVDFKWTSISFAEFVKRVDNLSHQQKIFVMESIEAGLAKGKNNNGEGEVAEIHSPAVNEAEEQYYHLRGYFLCPCL